MIGTSLAAVLGSILLLSPAAPVRVLVLPLLSGGPGDTPTASEASSLLGHIISEMDGVSCLSLDKLDDKVRSVIRELLRRCGKAPDCQQKIGLLVGAGIIISGKADNLNQGILLDLELLDVGSGKSIARISRTLTGSQLQRAAAIEAMLTRVLFPERLVGSLDVFMQPAGSKVFIDGRLIIPESGPQAHFEKLRAGQHTLRLVKPGYQDFYALVQVPFSGTSRLEAKMRASEKIVQPYSKEVVTKNIEDSHWYEHWWVWTIIGILAAGTTASTLILTR